LEHRCQAAGGVLVLLARQPVCRGVLGISECHVCDEMASGIMR
jgi:hypothetical protein